MLYSSPQATPPRKAGTRIKTKTKPPDTPKYRNSALTIDERVADLLSRMTLEEKIGQIAPSGNPKTEIIDPTGTYTSDILSEAKDLCNSPVAA